MIEMASECVPKRGRPATVNKDVVIDLLYNHVRDIFDLKTNCLISKSAPIWTVLAKELNNYVLPSTIYTYACDFKKDLLSNGNDKDKENQRPRPIERLSNSFFNESSPPKDVETSIEFDINEFKSWTEVIKKKSSHKRGGFTDAVRLKSEEYADLLADEIFKKTSLPCAFHIKGSYVALSYKNGNIKGKCDTRRHATFENPMEMCDVAIFFTPLEGFRLLTYTM